MKGADMRLKWIKDDTSLHTYRAETLRYRFVLVAPARAESVLWVQYASSDWGIDPIDHKLCRTRRSAERIAQRFEDKAITPRRLR
jgi:hypothetical protein